jgi:hypothetical protein
MTPAIDSSAFSVMRIVRAVSEMLDKASPSSARIDDDHPKRHSRHHSWASKNAESPQVGRAGLSSVPFIGLVLVLDGI